MYIIIGSPIWWSPSPEQIKLINREATSIKVGSVDWERFKKEVAEPQARELAETGSYSHDPVEVSNREENDLGARELICPWCGTILWETVAYNQRDQDERQPWCVWTCPSQECMRRDEALKRAIKHLKKSHNENWFCADCGEDMSWTGEACILAEPNNDENDESGRLNTYIPAICCTVCSQVYQNCDKRYREY